MFAPSKGRIEWRGEAISDLPAYRVVGKGLALSPEGWRLFVSQTVEQNLRLGATVLADRARIEALFERVYTLFPRLAERRRQLARTLVGRRASDACARTRADERAEASAARRAEPRVLRRRWSRRSTNSLQRLHEEGLTLLLAEQSIPLALGIADYAYVLQTGRIAIEGKAADLESNRQVQEIYLGINTRRARRAGLMGADPEARRKR